MLQAVTKTPMLFCKKLHLMCFHPLCLPVVMDSSGDGCPLKYIAGRIHLAKAPDIHVMLSDSPHKKKHSSGQNHKVIKCM